MRININTIMLTVIQMNIPIYCSNNFLEINTERIIRLLELFSDAKSAHEDALESYELKEMEKSKHVRERNTLISRIKNNNQRKKVIQIFESAKSAEFEFFRSELTISCPYQEILKKVQFLYNIFEITVVKKVLDSRLEYLYIVSIRNLLDFKGLFSEELFEAFRENLKKPVWKFVSDDLKIQNLDKMTEKAEIDSIQILFGNFRSFCIEFYKIYDLYVTQRS